MKMILGSLVLIATLTAQAKVIMTKVDYSQGGVALEGFIAYDTEMAKAGKKLPGMILVHDWMGVGEDVKMRAEQMAKLGYVAFVADIYGKDTRPKDAKEASAFAGQYRNGDRKNLRARTEAAVSELQKNKLVDTKKISAMGYCFGGTAALEMARAGQNIRSAISFHGGLSAVSKDDAKTIKVPLLVLHGAIDPFVSAEELNSFQKDLNEAKVDYQLISYSDSVHGFTMKHAGSDNKSGMAYNQKADERSFMAMKSFLTEINK